MVAPMYWFNVVLSTVIMLKIWVTDTSEMTFNSSTAERYDNYL